MAKLDFNKLPVTTLFGSRWSNFQNATKGKKIDKEYQTKYALTKGLCGLLSVTHPIENRIYKKKVEQLEMKNDPVFILGHWRSGTTFVHNVLSKDKNFGYNTTYQTIFSSAMLFGQAMFKSVMGSVMPDKRPTDNMELNVDQPQEEEFALSNLTTASFYNFWFFPQDTLEYCEKYLLMNDISEKERAEFRREFQRLVKTALYNTSGNTFLSKNPPHTGRVNEIIELYPNAKFIYLVRNPYTVFESTRSFFTNTIQPLKFQNISHHQLEENIIEVYKRLYNKYEADKALIPEGNLIEVRFEDFEADAFNQTAEIYKTLNLPDFEKAAPAIKDYIGEKKGHKKTRYDYDKQTISKVNENWAFAIDQWGYEKIEG
ncbi:sulfotransferase [Prolixibacteraceae bacterium Z1-6]|uniref:Sulfotransferase n=1 Tax=Draconibacterium aestuarii TaxID=2998507 RepID=A0A9X3F581_9BACT|nr:sulfotransferase [Prolixibacteraceae bacterium Z1-6]